jgi:glycine/D-amino acid oxidase-like deaminating enzyme
VPEAEVAVVGSGVMAAAVAWELARAGRRPLIVAGPTTPPEIGHVASGPALPYAEASAQLGRGAAGEVWESYRESRERLRSFVAGLPDDCGYRQEGAFLLALDRGGAAFLAESEDTLREDGFGGEFLDHYMIETRLPLFGFAGGYWAADDAEVDAARLLRALRDGAAERGATLADVGTVFEIAASAGAVEIVGDAGRARIEQAIVTEPAALAGAGLASMAGEALDIAAAIQPGLALPSLARASDGRFRWQASDREIRLEVDRGLDAESLLAGLPVREPSVRRAITTLAADRRLPVVGPPAEDSRIAVACAAEPCGLAFGAARWIADWVRTGRAAAPLAFRAAGPKAGRSPS